MIIQRWLLCAFLGIEIILFCLFYVHGSHGIEEIKNIEAENMCLEQEVNEMLKKINELEQEIIAWKTNSFYKERVAREQLQMARKDEQVYYIGE